MPAASLNTRDGASDLEPGDAAEEPELIDFGELVGHLSLPPSKPLPGEPVSLTPPPPEPRSIPVWAAVSVAFFTLVLGGIGAFAFLTPGSEAVAELVSPGSERLGEREETVQRHDIDPDGIPAPGDEAPVEDTSRSAEGGAESSADGAPVSVAHPTAEAATSPHIQPGPPASSPSSDTAPSTDEPADRSGARSRAARRSRRAASRARRARRAHRSAARAQARSSAAGSRSTANRAPEQPSRADVRAAIQSVMPQIRSCGADRQGHRVSVAFTFLPSGRVSQALVQNGSVSPAVRSCIARQARAARVPAFSGQALNVDFPITL